MGQILHGSARTTEAVRRAIQYSQESIRALATHYGINPKTVAKWKSRQSTADAPMGPKAPSSTVLSAEEEAIIVAFRKHTLLPLGVELWRVRRQEEQRDIVGEREVAAAMVGSAVENQEDILAGKLSRQDVEESLEARRIRSRHDQINAGPVLRRDRAVQIDVFANELGGDLGPDADRGPAWPWPVDPTETRFIGEHDPQATTSPGGRPLGFPHSGWKAIFLKAF